MLSVSYKTDYRLIPKHEESKYTSQPVKELSDVREQKLLPQTMDFPPLMHRLIVSETGNPHPKLSVKVNNKVKENFYRFAEVGEKPTIEFPPNMSLGKPASPNLYKNCGIDFIDKNTK